MLATAGRPALSLVALVASALLATACAKPAHWHLDSVRHLLPDLAFSLETATGPVTAQAYRGELVLLYFGYTHCPDVCPTTLARLKTVLTQLGPDAERVRVLFVSVDPERDTPALMASYVRAFGPRFVGLSGTLAQCEALAKRYRVGFNKIPSKSDPGQYTMNHSAGVYVFDPQGRAQLLGTETAPVADYVADLRQLLSAASAS